MKIWVLAAAAVLQAGDNPPVFSHKLHAPLKLACSTCHKTADKNERAGFPVRSDCMVCHASFKTEKIASSFPSQRVYKVADYVIFSHARHRAAEIECSTCHGSVTARDVMRVEHPTTMKACVDCHKSRNATTNCAACHELGQD